MDWRRNFIIMLLPAMAAFAAAAPGGFIKPTHTDTCPVCGMLIYPYPDWTAEIVLGDGSYLVFDGAKHLFQDYFRLEESGKGGAGLQLWVTDYETGEAVDGRRAFYVLGSDVKGPMGKELVPFANERDALNFMREHHGENIINMNEIKLLIHTLLE